MRKVFYGILPLLVLFAAGCTAPTEPITPPATATLPVENDPTATDSAAALPTDSPEPSLEASPTNEALPDTPLPVEESPTLEPSGTVVASEPTDASQEIFTRAGNPIIVDHTSVDLFDQIPDEYLEAARNTRMMWADRSVGVNIDEGLNCLTAASWASSPAHCRVDYIGSSWNFQSYSSGAPARITFEPDPVRYDRSNWVFEILAEDWSPYTHAFITELAPRYIDQVDVLSYQFTYLNVEEGNDIADPEKGFFSNNPDKTDIYDLEAFMAEHPDKTFIFWTTSLARAIGSRVSTEFNDQMRQYAKERNMVLFDVADIESHTDQGFPCYDNRDGVEYCNQQGKCENHPDDGVEFPAICQDYTTETNGGHLGSVSGGKIRIAKAFWVLMAQIAGWEP